MKKVVFILAMLLSSSSFIACSENSYAGDEPLYEQANGGDDDGEVNDDPDSGGS